MAENLTRQILSEHLVDGELTPGEPISLKIDQTLLQDATGTMSLMQFEQLDIPRVKVDRAVQYIDHNVIQLDYKNPDDHRMLQALARKYGIHFSRPGNGICHYVHIERFAKPGAILVGADSHTTTSGALGQISIGAGGLDVAVAMGGYPYEIACPEVVEVHLTGTLARPWVQAKDIILELLRRSQRQRRQEQGLRVHRRGHGGPERARARHDRQHDRRAGRHLGGLPARRQDARLALAPAARGRLRGDRPGRRLRVRRPRGDRPGRARPADRQALEPRQRGRDRGGGRAPRSSRCASAPRSTPPTPTSPCPGAILADKDGQLVNENCTVTATPGSRQILVAIAESGVYRQLVEGGVRMLEPVCGPCVGMGQAPPSDANSLRTFNRNFPGRSGTPEDSVFLCSPAVAAVSMLNGEITDPRMYGDAPELLEMPELKPYVDDVHIFAPADEDEAESIEIPRGPNIKTPPEHVPLEDSVEAKIATVQPDDITTGDLAPDGVVVMSYRSNIPAIAEFTFQHRDKEFRGRMQEWGSGFIVGGENYGQGSSREHAALAPLQLGVKAVFAKSFARIHRRNLVAQGILALTFKDDKDYDRAEVGKCWKLPKVKEELEEGSDEITVETEDGDEFTVTHDFAPTEREILVEGGLLHYLKERGEQAAA